MEHGISDESLRAIVELRQFLRVVRASSSFEKKDD